MTPSGTEAQIRGDEQGLLERFVGEIVVDEYAPAPPGTPPGARSGDAYRWWALAVGALIGLVVIVALSNARQTTDQREQTRAALISRISATSSEVEARRADVEQAQGAVDRIQAEVLAAASEQESMSSEDLARLAELAGTTELSGPGLIVTVDDAADAQAGSLNRVLDRDLQDIVNALWRAGARGIAVNDQRLTNVTAIRAAGDAILVNYQPLARPYRVAAVGTSTVGTGDSGLQRLLTGLSRDYGLVTALTTGDVALPAGELRTPRFATTDPPGTAQRAGTESGAPTP